MRLSFHDLAPAAEPWLRDLSQSPVVTAARESVWIFAAIEAGHLLSLAILAGAVLGLNLKLLGLVLKDETASDVERWTRPWLHVGVVGALTTGVAMGIINVASLYGSVAFFVKMVALVAAILFSYAVSREVVRRSGKPSATAIAVAASAALIWIAAVLAFALTPSVRPGVALIIGAGVALIAVGVRGRRNAPDPSARLAAYASVLAWVTVIAAGRWIGFS